MKKRKVLVKLLKCPKCSRRLTVKKKIRNKLRKRIPPLINWFL
jgi:4-hydroxy-3-methylbut-2-en-1-yl diphosphate synthase IspG/GcpE